MAGAAIRTIAVHLPTASLCGRLLDAAVPLAQAHDARLVGVHVLPAVVVYADATVSMSSDFIMAQQQAFQDESRAVQQVFASRVGGAGVAYSWHLVDSANEPTMRAAGTCCNTADLVVATQFHDSIPAAAGYSPDELVLATGRPVLIIPASGGLGAVGRRVLIAWNGSREASRAAFDCLPLLHPDAEVRIIAIDSPRGEATLSAITEAVLRHGVRAVGSAVSRREGRNVSGEIIELAGEMSADLIVLGCYGHSRLREAVFGGATTRILRDMTLPVLMAH
jgi:nucleotide-binding universal stress UspA family protein